MAHSGVDHVLPGPPRAVYGAFTVSWPTVGRVPEKSASARVVKPVCQNEGGVMHDLTEMPVEIDLDLDVRIATAGPVASVLMSNTDDGCDTVKTGDC